MHARELHASGRMRFWRMVPCDQFQDNLESNSGLNFDADCTHNSETYHTLSEIDYVALDRFSDFKHATYSFKLSQTGRTV